MSGLISLPASCNALSVFHKHEQGPTSYLKPPLSSKLAVADALSSQVSLPTQYNDQNQPPVGALANALGRLQASRPLRELRETVKGVTKQLPEAIQEATSKIDEYARGMISGSGSTLFEELGLYYIGPIDGHNLDNLLAVLEGPLFSLGVEQRLTRPFRVEGGALPLSHTNQHSLPYICCSICQVYTQVCSIAVQ